MATSGSGEGREDLGKSCPRERVNLRSGDKMEVISWRSCDFEKCWTCAVCPVISCYCFLYGVLQCAVADRRGNGCMMLVMLCYHVRC